MFTTPGFPALACSFARTGSSRLYTGRGARRVMVTQRPRDLETESFAGLLLRYRGRTGLTQRDLAARLATNRRSIQDWESGAYYPSAGRLQALIHVLLESGGLTVGCEAVEAH